MLWLQEWPGDAPGPLETDPDSVYHLHRVVQCVEHYPMVTAVDPRSHYPTSFRVHWPAPHTWLIATIVYPFTDVSLDSVAATVRWIPPILGALLVILLGIHSATIGANTSRTTVVVAFVGLNGLLLLLGGSARIDHHIWTPIALLLALIGLRNQSAIVWSAAFFTLFAFTPDALLYATILYSVSIISAAITKQKVAPSFIYGPAVASLAALFIHRLLTNDNLPMRSLDWSRPTLFLVIWMVAIAVAGDALVRIRKNPIPVSGICIGALGGFVFILWLTGNLSGIWARLTGAERMWVGEEQSPYRYGYLDTPIWLQLLVVPCLWSIFRAIRELVLRNSPANCALWIISSIMLIGGMREMRMLMAAIPCIAIASEDFLWASSQLLKEKLRLVSFIVASIAMLAVSCAFGYSIRTGYDQLNIDRTNNVVDWVKNACIRDDHSLGVYARWPIGHHLNVKAGASAYLDPFNHEDIYERLQNSYRIVHADELKKLMEKNKLQLMITSSYDDTFGQLDRNRSHLSTTKDGVVQIADEHVKSAIMRLHASNGFGMEFPFLRPRFLSIQRRPTNYQLSSGAFSRETSLDQIYEYVKGVVIRIPRSGPTALVQVSFEVQKETGEHFTVTHTLPTSSGPFSYYQTALPAPVTETTFSVLSSYRITNGDHSFEVAITPDMIRNGQRLALRAPVLE